MDSIFFFISSIFFGSNTVGCFRFATNEVAIYPPKTPVACGPSRVCRLPLVAAASINNFF